VKSQSGDSRVGRQIPRRNEKFQQAQVVLEHRCFLSVDPPKWRWNSASHLGQDILVMFRISDSTQQ